MERLACGRVLPPGRAEYRNVDYVLFARRLRLPRWDWLVLLGWTARWKLQPARSLLPTRQRPPLENRNWRRECAALHPAERDKSRGKRPADQIAVPPTNRVSRLSVLFVVDQ